MPNDPNKPDFSDVVSGGSSTAPSPAGSPAFSDVVSGSSSTAPSPAGSSADSTTSRMYVVQAGDSLSKIAKKFYGNANSWKRIFEANKDVIRNPDLIQPGWKLQIPD